jgi:hypothetical protein
MKGRGRGKWEKVKWNREKGGGEWKGREREGKEERRKREKTVHSTICFNHYSHCSEIFSICSKHSFISYNIPLAAQNIPPAPF